MSCGVGRRWGWDLALLWCRLAAIAPIRPLAWEAAYAVGVALKRPQKKKRRNAFNVEFYLKHMSGPISLYLINIKFLNLYQFGR